MSNSDQAERRAAVTTFDQNVVVTAGAGTGKTTLLIDRLVLTLLRPDAIPVTEIVALTFTRKAAQEMKSRLRQRLSAHVDRTVSPPEGVTAEEAAARAAGALRQIEYAAISTLHAFAADLLRRFPGEAGIDPLFREDDGEQFSRQFQERWTAWLSDEMSSACPRRDRWKGLLIQISMTALRDLAAALCAERVPLDAVEKRSGRLPAPATQVAPVAPVAPIAAWLHEMAQETDALLSRHPENRKIEKQVRAAAEVFRQRARIPAASDPMPDDDTLTLLRSGVSAVKGWSDEEVDRAKELVGDGRRH
jgi:ATP-dependent helicase/nuclease subunit A